jgi:alpha-glucosidase
MFLEFPHDKAFETNDTEFMFGPDLLIAPKLNEKFEPYDVTLPPGIWYDLWTGRETGSVKNLNPPLDTLPVFVRGGAIVPEQPVVQHTEEIPQGPLQISVYPGPDCHGSLYQDDGNTLAYTLNEFLRMEFSCDSQPGSLRFTFSTTHQTYKPWWKLLNVTFFGIEHVPQKLSLDGEPINTGQFDSATGSLSVEIPVRDQGKIEITK